MLTKGLFPNIITYNALINGLCKYENFLFEAKRQIESYSSPSPLTDTFRPLHPINYSTKKAMGNDKCQYSCQIQNGYYELCQLPNI